MEKQYNFRIYPNKAQEEQIQRSFGCVRFVYNYYLNKRIEMYKNGSGLFGYNECCRDLTVLKHTAGYEWLFQADDDALRRSIRHLDWAFRAFFRNLRKKEENLGFPRFKAKKSSRKSYTSVAGSPQRYVSRVTGEVHESPPKIVLSEKYIKLPKLGLVRCKVSKQVAGRLLSATVSQAPSGKYYVSVTFTECVSEELPKTGAAIGLHMGIKDLAVKSNGDIIANQRFQKSAAKKIARLNRWMSRKPSDSKNREKARLRLARAYERIYNQRTDYLHKTTTQLVRDYDVICIRDEQVKESMSKARYAKWLADVALGQFTRQLGYKSDWYGKHLIKIDHSHPSVQLCSSCGYKSQEISNTRIASWQCPKCGEIHNRRVNAAVNIRNEGIRIAGLENTIASPVQAGSLELTLPESV